MVIWEIQNVILENNKELKVQLHKFVRNYILKLNKYNLDLVWKKIFSYTDLAQFTTYFDFNQDNFDDNLLHLLQFPEEHNIEEVLFELLYNFLLLPPYTNQKQFDKDLEKRIANLDNFSYKYFDNFSFFLKPILAQDIWDKIYFSKWEDEVIIKKYLSNNDFIEKITLYTYLPWYQDNRLDDMENSIDITFLVSYDENVLDLREEIIDYFDWHYDVWTNGDYLFASYPELDVYINVSMNWLSWMEVDWWKEYFEIRVYTKPKKFGKDVDFYNYLSDSLLYLENISMEIWKIVNWDFIKNSIKSYFKELETEYYKDMSDDKFWFIIEEFSRYLWKKDIEHIVKLFEDNKTKEAFILANNLFLKKFPLKSKKRAEIIDLNYDVFDDNDFYENKEKVWWNNKEKIEILNQVNLDDISNKLFLENDTEKKVSMLKKYIKNREKYIDKLLKAPKWAILYWPPWTWKTETVKNIAKETWLKTYYVDISDILNMYVWESERKIKQMFQEYYKILENEKAILFIDEADWFFWKRDESDSDKKNGVRSIALQELEWFATNKNLQNGFIFLWTNFLENIDKALKDRFSFYLKYDLPSKEKRSEYISYMLDFLQKEKWLKVNVKIEKIVEKTERWSYRSLYNLFNNTIMDVQLIKDKNIIETEDLLENLLITTEKKEEWWNKMWFLK